MLRNAWISTITLLGLHVGSLVGGAVITETVFAIPGVGRLMIDSIFARDYAVVQGLTIVLAIVVSRRVPRGRHAAGAGSIRGSSPER